VVSRVPLLFRREPDVFELLRIHARAVGTCLEAFARWSRTGETADRDAVRSTRYSADENHKSLVRALMEVLSTPVDREDIYVLSERLQDVAVAAKNIVREAEALDMRPNDYTAELGRLVAGATESVVDAVCHLHRNTDASLAAVDAAASAVHAVDRAYRRAMGSIWDDCAEPRIATARHAVYRRYADLGETVDNVIHRVWYGILKDT
jgi:uncharacterized protein Yka (UPF0111/DUF47 family)